MFGFPFILCNQLLLQTIVGSKLLEAEAKRLTQAFLADRRRVVESMFKIPHKLTGELVDYRYNPALAYLEKQLSGKDFVLKSRQLYITTYFELMDLLSAIYYPNFSGILLCHKDDDAVTFVQKYKFFYNQLPEEVEVVKGFPFPFRPKLLTDSVHMLEFEHKEGNSYLRINGAQSLSLARGFTPHRVHATEVAVWSQEYAEKALTAVLGALTPQGSATIETTAMGAQGYAFDLYKKAKSGDTVFKPIFLGWFLDDTARLSIGKGLPEDNRPLIFNEHELRMMREHKIGEEEIRYYRWAQKKLGDKAAQELAEDDITCFLQSGNTVFLKDTISEYLDRCFSPLSYDGEFEVYQLPRPTSQYVLGVDVMEGIGTEDRDYHSIFILNANTTECCGIYRSRVPIPELVAKIAELGREYNTALAVVERNTYGAVVCQYLDTDAHYPNIYGDGEKMGNLMTRASKPAAIERLKRAMADRSWKCFSKAFWDETTSFVRNPDGRMGSRGDSHDDIIMASAHALFGAENYTESSKGVIVEWR